MKMIMTAMMATLLLAMGTSVYADEGHGTPGQMTSVLTDTAEAVTTALGVFAVDNTDEVVDLYKGIKAAPMKTGGMSVKVYLTDGSKISYSCHRHSASDPFECHEK